MTELDVTEFDVRPADGRTLHAYDTGGTGRPVFWLHGTPNVGAPPEPLFPAARRLGLRWVSYDRPGYGGSTPHPGRRIGSALPDVTAVADALGIDRFAVFGHSGGGPHALACGTSDRVTAVVSAAGLAPSDAEGLDWFGGMAESGVASLEAARRGPAAKAAHERFAVVSDPGFAPADLAALDAEWGWFGKVVGPATEDPGGLIADDLAYVAPWGVDLAAITAPVLLLHGGQDRVVPPTHGAWLARALDAELRTYPEDGHISVLTHADAALAWIRDRS
ncbi:alpha/beta hydrolase fold containing protein [Saccharothrix espanaensis DSM 44229]|uniref:Alpha/beta hydrolase fold containing protein n=1 Tax=Saccharothrix espanaensis (strain ATCC 51144 / DSM 44229 / JCM 9112 / NBRC 15066 / NRRL 15764) TaxID=1179773 RepID=K0K8N4_SACES|nr:alpha/beta hydrolase fold containing protein [Saccharothrix espanaensis DSM 44229]